MRFQRPSVLSLAVCAALGGFASVSHADPSPATPAANEDLGEVMEPKEHSTGFAHCHPTALALCSAYSRS